MRPSKGRTPPAGTPSASTSSALGAAEPRSTRTRAEPRRKRIVAAQGAPGLAYGLGSVLVGVTLADRGYSDAAVGGILAALLAGNALASLLLAHYGDRVGRRRCYRLLLLTMAGAGAVFALTGSLPALLIAALTGTISTDVVESGPFTSLEQAMLPHATEGRDPTRLFSTHNTVATLAGSAGASHWSAPRRSGCFSTRSPRPPASSPSEPLARGRSRPRAHARAPPAAPPLAAACRLRRHR